MVPLSTCRPVGRWGWLIWVLAVAMSAAAFAQVSTTQYFPFRTGDERVLAGDGGTGFNRITGQVKVGGTQAWRDVILNDAGQEQLPQFWTQDAQGTHWIGTESEGQVVTLNPTVTIPATVTSGQQLNLAGTVYTSNAPVGQYSGKLRILSTSATVQTPAGSFSNCLQFDINITVTVTVSGQTQAIHLNQTQAAGVGALRTVSYGADGTGQEYLLIYADVGGVTWGHPPVNTSAYFPLRTGDRWTFLDTDARGPSVDLVEAETLVPVQFAGHQAYPWREAWAEGQDVSYWYREGGTLYRSGEGEAGQQSPYEPPLVLLRSQAYLGQVMRTQGQIGGAGGGAPFDLRVRVQDLDVVADVPAGPFTACVRLEIQGTIGTAPDQEAVATEWWLAPGVGIVKMVDYDTGGGVSSAAGTPVETEELMWAVVGGREYGQDPRVATAAYFPLKAGDRWLALAQTRDETPVWVDVETLPRVTLPSGQAYGRRERSPYETDLSYWQWSGGKVLRVAEGEGADQAFYDPGALLLEPIAYLGQRFTSQGELRSDAGSLPYSFVVEVTGTGQTVEVPAGPFNDCLRLLEEGTIGAGAQQRTVCTEYWLAPGVGIIKWLAYDPTTLAAVGQEWSLSRSCQVYWAGVAGTEYGQPPATVATAGYLPLQAGDRYVYCTPTGAIRTVVVEPETLINGLAVWPFLGQQEGRPDETQWWLRDADGTKWLGFAAEGHQTVADPPALLMAPAVRRYDVAATAGDLLADGNPGGPYDLASQVTETDVAVVVPAGTFEHCLVVKVTGWLGPPASREQVDRTYCLAPGVGLVRFQATEGAETVTLSLRYALVGGKPYGEPPQPGQPGDVNGDGYVDFRDAREMMERVLGGAAAYKASCDLYPYAGTLPDITPSPDGAVDLWDLKTFIRLWQVLYAGGSCG